MENKPLFRTQYNGYKSVNDMEHPDDERNTIPGQSMSIREILDRYIKRQPIDTIQRNGYYSDTDDFEDYDETTEPAFDISDAYNRLNEIRDGAERQKQEQLSRNKEQINTDTLSGKSDPIISPLPPIPGE